MAFDITKQITVDTSQINEAGAVRVTLTTTSTQLGHLLVVLEMLHSLTKETMREVKAREAEPGIEAFVDEMKAQHRAVRRIYDHHRLTMKHRKAIEATALDPFVQHKKWTKSDVAYFVRGLQPNVTGGTNG